MIEILVKVKNRVGIKFPLLTAVAYQLLGKERRGFVPGSARYCYSVWLRHLVLICENGLCAKLDTVGELGPGDSFGVGLAAMLSGVNKYYAFDVDKHASSQKSIEILDELVELFRKHENIPDEDEFPEVKPNLASYEFPKKILTDELLNKSLAKDRVASIRNAILNKSRDKKVEIKYFVPWNDLKILKENSVDLIFSQAVLEYIENLPHAYQAMYYWLKPGGIISHTIDFRSHGTARRWNGHWAHSDFIWNLMKGKINRQPHSVYINYLKKYGYKIVCDKVDNNATGINRKKLASTFKNLSDEDLVTSGAFIQAVKE